MIEAISLPQIALMLIPVLCVFFIQWFWRMPNPFDTLYATLRMLIQLLIVAFLLKGIFESNNYVLTLTVLFIMLAAASWISIRPLKHNKNSFLSHAFISIFFSSLINLFFIFLVIKPAVWYQASLWIPIAGMVFSAAMNSVSLAAERFENAHTKNNNYIESRNEAYNAALIPQINATLAVGLVALPGMMTGQILSGVEPFIAVRYQIIIMCMALSVSGISAAMFLQLIKNKYK